MTAHPSFERTCSGGEFLPISRYWRRDPVRFRAAKLRLRSSAAGPEAACRYFMRRA